MTLVVARVTPLGVRLAGDMRITDPGAIRRGFIEAALKLILLSPTLCIAYAGQVGGALGAIRDVATDDLSLQAATERITEAHLRTGQAAEFLIAGLRPSRLVVVKDGVATDRSSAWLGDLDAFGEYQHHYHLDRWRPPPEFYESTASAEDLDVAGRMGDGMQAVVYGPTHDVVDGELVLLDPRGGSHSRVGEAVVAVGPRVEDGLFKYLETSRMEASRRDEPLPPGLGVVPPDWGSAERGAFSYAMLRPEQPGVGAIGLYFYEGRLGVLYAPLILEQPEIYSGSPCPAAFVEMVRLRHGILLTGFVPR
jgi:hypothetical protein